MASRPRTLLLAVVASLALAVSLSPGASADPDRRARSAAPAATTTYYGASRLAGKDPYHVRTDAWRVRTTAGPTLYPLTSLANDMPPQYKWPCLAMSGDTVPDFSCVFGDRYGTKRVALLGDSKAIQWAPALDRVGKANGWKVYALTKSSCALMERHPMAECATYNTALMGRLTSDQRFDMYIVSSGNYSTGAGDKMAPYWRRLIAYGKPFIVLQDTPRPLDPALANASNLKGVLWMNKCLAAAVQASPVNYARDCSFPANDGEGTPALRRAASLVTGEWWYNMNPWVCPFDRCAPVIGMVAVWRDAQHLSATYSRTLGPPLSRRFYLSRALANPLPMPLNP